MHTVRIDECKQVTTLSIQFERVAELHPLAQLLIRWTMLCPPRQEGPDFGNLRRNDLRPSIWIILCPFSRDDG